MNNIITLYIGQTWSHSNVFTSCWSSVSSSYDGSTIVATNYQTNGGIYVAKLIDNSWSWKQSGSITGYWYDVAASKDGRILVAVQLFSNTGTPGNIYMATTGKKI